MKYLLLTALVAGSIVSLHAAEPRDDTTILDRGVLTHTSPKGMLRLDVATGAFELRASDGRSYRDVLVPYLPAQRNALTRVPFMVLRGGSEKTVCTDQSETVAQAAALATRLCDEGNTGGCRGAREALAGAMNEFNDCIMASWNPPGGGGAGGSDNQPGNGGSGDESGNQGQLHGANDASIGLQRD